MDRENLKEAADRLRKAGLRPPRQRLRLLYLLTRSGDRHVTAAEMLDEARAAGLKVSFSTIYNTLRSFTEHGLLKIVPLGAGRILFDTNTQRHFHFYDEAKDKLVELPPDLPALIEVAKGLSEQDRKNLEVLAYVRKPET